MSGSSLLDGMIRHVRYEPDFTDIALIQTTEQEAGSSNLPIPTTSCRG